MKIIQRKAIFYYTLGILNISVISVFVAAKIFSNNISYSNPNTSATNVEDALNELYKNDISSSAKNVSYTFDYNGSYQQFTAPIDGYYKIELWGAQGGSIEGTGYYSNNTVRATNVIYTGGKGAYTSGDIYLKSGSIFYIYIGSAPTATNITLSNSGVTAGGYNGGGNRTSHSSRYGAPGGGATDIRITSGSWNQSSSINSRIMVSAGGGGANFRNYGYGEGNGGAGGTLNGVSGEEALISGTYWRSDYSTGYFIGLGGTQTAGGQSEQHATNGDVTHSLVGAFGGVSTITKQSGGGSGYYSGAGVMHGGAGGGSSYISGYQGCVAINSATSLTPRNDANGTQCTESSASSDVTCSYHYSGYVFTNVNMIAGNASMPTHDGTSTMTGNSGNGYARITYLGKTLS